MTEKEDDDCFSEDMDAWWERLNQETDFVKQRRELDVINSTRDNKCLTVEVTKEEYEQWCRPWRKFLIIKLLGKNVSLSFIRNRLEKLWKPTESFHLLRLDNRFFITSFKNKKDLTFACQEGPWMIVDSYLLVYGHYHEVCLVKSKENSREGNEDGVPQQGDVMEADNVQGVEKGSKSSTVQSAAMNKVETIGSTALVAESDENMNSKDYRPWLLAK